MTTQFTAGQQVTIRADRAAKRPRIDGMLHHYTKRGTAVVAVPRGGSGVDSDDFDEHEVAADQLVPYKPKVSVVRSNHTRQIVRLLKQGVTMFRIGSPKGHIVQIESYDVDEDTTVARGLRGRPRYPAISELYPLLAEEK